MTGYESKKAAAQDKLDSMEREALKLALEKIATVNAMDYEYQAWAREALAQLEQKPVKWKLVPIEPTDEMLKAMDECSTEGYDERLYAGHAASVYMAAVDVAPTPPKAQPEQEPVGRFAKFTDGIWREVTDGSAGQPLYTAPPQRTWVGLMLGVRVEGSTVVIHVQSNDKARLLCSELVNEMEKNT